MQTGASEKWNENVLALACALVGAENLIKLVGIHRFTCYISNYLCTGAFVGYEGAVLHFALFLRAHPSSAGCARSGLSSKNAKRELKPQCEAGKRFRFIMPQTAAAVSRSAIGDVLMANQFDPWGTKGKCWWKAFEQIGPGKWWARESRTRVNQCLWFNCFSNYYSWVCFRWVQLTLFELILNDWISKQTSRHLKF